MTALLWLRGISRRQQPIAARQPLQVVTSLRPPGWRDPQDMPGVTWLTAWDVPIPGPPDVTVFGPPVWGEP